ncbi:hypothetical protein [Paramaledivibacter caminithermalis]|jgi:regulator of protease activity HflC (stomatin/prohibitin superfamily)|uniref:Uncharacterized protein n=1 Tax=Paramaledivibacter caminithermalis (strain DSM 15212 / CIP 107654 / DViRD3) TaxID=1121301 RepID=A0A1M6L0Z6_PARC5|nr:hypothetical protein [Paramaledivibacter caminithermalis]SHJ64802.1 hypothetical protein SAMN02745912_00591 [Paramaledivibacter caminithermalis DSM 15212]
MENIINKIVDIDKKALDIKHKTEKMIDENGKRLNKKLSEIEKKELEKAKALGQKEYEKLIKQGQHKSNEIKLIAEKECEKLEKSYTRIHKKLEKEIFTKIFENN